MNLQQAGERLHPIPLVSVQRLDLSSILLPCCVDRAYHVVADVRFHPPAPRCWVHTLRCTYCKQEVMEARV